MNAMKISNWSAGTVTVLIVGMLLLSGCSTTYMPINQQRDASEDATISEWTSSNRQVTRGANQTAPDFNDINTCPKGMQRVDHSAGGGGDSSVRKTEEGTKYEVTVDFGQSHKCK